MNNNGIPVDSEWYKRDCYYYCGIEKSSIQVGMEDVRYIVGGQQ